MSHDSIVRLIARKGVEFFAWEIRDDQQRMGFGTCATIAELRCVEVRAGLASVRIADVGLSPEDRAFATHHGWEITPEKGGDCVTA